MNKAAWEELNSMDRDKEVAWRLMGWKKPEKDPDWRSSKQEYVYDEPMGTDGPIAYRNKDTGEITPFDAILWHDPSGRVSGTCRIPKYTTDRNACALVLDEIEKKGFWVDFEDAFLDEANEALEHIDVRLALHYILNVSPDYICYCAVKAVEE